MTRILIIGGGIGGLAAGVAMARRGLVAHVYEAAPALEPVGKGIWVPGNAMQVLERLGLDDAVQQAGWSLERICVKNRSGQIYMDVDLLKFKARFRHAVASIHRAELVRILSQAIPPERLHLGKRLVGITETPVGVTARFEDGSEVHGDVLIGADGIRSVVREQILPGITFRYSSQSCYRGVAEMALPTDLARTCWEVWGGATRFGFSAIGPRQVYWFAPMKAEAGSPAPADLGAYLNEVYAGFPAPIPEIVGHSDPAQVIRTDLYDFPPLASWVKGRVALLGDAAHAMTPNLGQGGAQAIEDAYVLADALAGQVSTEVALANYQRRRRPKALWVARTAWQLGQMAHLEGWITWFRDLAFRMTPGWVNDGQIARLFTLEGQD